MIRREIYLSKIKPFYHSDLIKVLIGIRRSGKSVILTQIIEELISFGVNKKNIIYINFEDFEYIDISDAKSLHTYVKERITNKTEKYYLFFDEIQVVSDFERAINSFRSVFTTSIFITGSNGKLLSGELATYLSGRYVSFRIMPFSFKEIYTLKVRDNNFDKEEVFMDFLQWGGMPQRFQFSTLQETKVFLNDLYNSIVLRDIVQRTGGKDIDLLNRIIEYLVQTPSQSFSAKGISKFFENGNRKVSTETLYNYLDHIVSSLIMTKARRYDIRGKKILLTLDKYYLTDMGLGRIRNSGFKIEMGAMLENVVFNELLVRDYEVFVGKTRNGEIDFIATKGEEKLYFQVTYYLTDEKVIEREFGAFRNVPDNFPKYVLSMDKVDFSRDGIIHKNVIEFLLENY